MTHVAVTHAEGAPSVFHLKEPHGRHERHPQCPAINRCAVHQGRAVEGVGKHRPGAFSCACIRLTQHERTRRGNRGCVHTDRPTYVAGKPFVSLLIKVSRYSASADPVSSALFTLCVPMSLIAPDSKPVFTRMNADWWLRFCRGCSMFQGFRLRNFHSMETGSPCALNRVPGALYGAQP